MSSEALGLYGHPTPEKRASLGSASPPRSERAHRHGGSALGANHYPRPRCEVQKGMAPADALVGMGLRTASPSRGGADRVDALDRFARHDLGAGTGKRGVVSAD